MARKKGNYAYIDEGQIPVEELERVLCRVKDVVAARVVSDGAFIAEIHILARAGRSPHLIIRDLDSAVIARFGTNLSTKKVSVAQVQGDVDDSAPSRLRFVGASLLSSGHQAEARVTLEREGEHYEGSVTGSAARGNRLRLIARATLAAVEGYFHAPFVLSLHGVALVRLGEKSAAVVVVNSFTPEEEETLTGSALVGSDEKEAVVKATLNAVNRKLAQLIMEQWAE